MKFVLFLTTFSVLANELSPIDDGRGKRILQETINDSNTDTVTDSSSDVITESATDSTTDTVPD